MALARGALIGAELAAELWFGVAGGRPGLGAELDEECAIGWGTFAGALPKAGPGRCSEAAAAATLAREGSGSTGGD